MSRIDRIYAHEKAALVLRSFVSILEIDTNLGKFCAAFPSARIAVLLLGSSPSPTVVSLILKMIGLHLAAFANFARKLELASFWHVLKTVLPPAWDDVVQATVFDLLFGRFKPSYVAPSDNTIKCPAILPSVMSSLEYGLNRMLDRDTYVGRDLLANCGLILITCRSLTTDDPLQQRRPLKLNPPWKHCSRSLLNSKPRARRSESHSDPDASISLLHLRKYSRLESSLSKLGQTTESLHAFWTNSRI
jgi:hypothetical protein